MSTGTFKAQLSRAYGRINLRDNFGVKYVGEEHVEHLMSVLRESYNITHDWTGREYIGIMFDRDYKQRKVHLSMPGYIGRG